MPEGDRTGSAGTSERPAPVRRRGLPGRLLRGGGPFLVALLALQFLLFWPSLTGRRILLPTDILAASPGWPGGERAPPPRAVLLSDLVLQHEPFRAFAAAEVRAGRFPLWNPLAYCGSPLLAAGQAGVLSPFMAVRYLFPSPRAIAWIHLLLAVFAGMGAYLFFRRGLGVAPWPAQFGGVVYPFTGFLVLWDGFPLAEAVAWLPWLCLAADRAVRRPGGVAGVGLAACVAGVLLAGHPGMSASVLLVAGAYGVFRLLARPVRSLPRSLAAAAAGTALGLLLSMPATLPAMEYLFRHSARAPARAAGGAENPPVGLTALTLVVAPDTHGTLAPEAPWVLEGVNKLESPAGGYAGLLTALALAPLALLARRRRGLVAFLLLLALSCLSPGLGVPLLSEVFRLPPFSLLQNNRLVFGTGFALLTLAVVGLEALRRRSVGRVHRVLFAVPAAALLALAAHSLLAAQSPPASLRAKAESLERARAAGAYVDPDAARLTGGYAGRFAAINLRTAGLSAAALLFLGAVLAGRGRRFGAAAAVLAAAEVAFTAWGVTPQSPPETYYPRVRLLGALRQEGEGRILPVRTLLPNLPMAYGLRDVRGYDALDPDRYVELLDACRHPDSPRVICAALYDYFPENALEPARVSSVIHMLDVRWFVFGGAPPPGVRPDAEGAGAYALRNPRALGRVFVPRHVASAPDRAERLARLGSPAFDAAAESLLEETVPPEIAGLDARGSGRVVTEAPSRLEVALDMQTPGLVVISDLWYPGWVARLDGRDVPILRVNHALKGIVAPVGRHELVLSFAPASLAWGLGFAAAALPLLVLWWLRARRRGPRAT